MQHVMGLDPGFGESGVVLIDEDERPLEWFTLSRKTGDDLSRAIIMGDKITNWITTMADKYDMQDLRIGLELPVVAVKKVGSRVVGMNASTYAKQMRLYHEIESQLLLKIIHLKLHIEIAEIGNATSKRLLTGDGRADKGKMLACGPFTQHKPKYTAITLSDAYAHALAGKAALQPIKLWQVYEQEIVPNREYP